MVLFGIQVNDYGIHHTTEKRVQVQLLSTTYFLIGKEVSFSVVYAWVNVIPLILF